MNCTEWIDMKEGTLQELGPNPPAKCPKLDRVQNRVSLKDGAGPWMAASITQHCRLKR